MWTHKNGCRLKFYRTLLGLTQEKLAAEIESSKQYLSEIERGVNVPSLSWLARVCKVLGVNPLQLFMAGNGDENADEAGGHPEGRARCRESQLVALVGTWTIDLAHGRDAWSRSFCRMLGSPSMCSPSLKRFLKHLGKGDVPFFTAFYRKLADGDVPLPITCTIKQKNGLRRTLHVQGDILPNGRGGPGSACATFTDITDCMEFNAHVLSIQEQLQKVIQEKTRTLSQALEGVQKELNLRVTAENMLQEKNAQVERLLSVAPAVLYAFSPSIGGTKYYSPHLRRILGFTSRELEDAPMLWHDSIHPEDLPMVDEAIHKGQQGEATDLEYRIRDKRGRWRWIHDKARPERDDRGQVIITGAAMDITERKETEDKLQKAQKALVEHSEQRFRRLVENISEIVFRYELMPQQRFAYVSPSVTGLHGYTPQEHYEDPYLAFKIVHPEDRALLESFVQGGFSEQDTLVLRWVTKSGRIIWTEQRIIPLLDEQGEVTALEGFARDITRRKEAEDALRESRARLDLALKTAKMGYWRYDCASHRVEWSEGHEALFGIPMSEFEGNLDAVQQIVHPDDRAHGMENLSKALEEDVPFDNTYRVIHPDGSVRLLHSYGYVSRDESGAPMDIFGITQDITPTSQSS